MEVQEYKIDTEFIKLQQVIKAANLVSQGSDAKELILSGEVKLNGEVVLQRGKKVHSGDTVEVNGFGTIKVL